VLAGGKPVSRALEHIIVACVAAAVLAVCAVAVLNSIQKPVDVAFTTSGVRI